MKNINKKWFSIIIWMWIVIVATLSAYFILSFALPFAKNIKWIENSSASYYHAYGWIEDSMYFINKERSSLTQEKVQTNTTSSWYSYTTMSSWSMIPLAWYWNSDFDTDYNIININDPIQLDVWYMTNDEWSNAKFYFKVPDMWQSINTLSWWTNPIINWSLSSENDTLISTWTYITADFINSNTYPSYWTIWTKIWESIFWTWWTFKDFYNWEWIFSMYTNNCKTNSCILKMSVVNNLYLDDSKNTKLPYLEYKIDFWSLTWNKPALRYTTINSIWKSYWFRKDLEIKVPQQTINQAFDFTVFQ